MPEVTLAERPLTTSTVQTTMPRQKIQKDNTEQPVIPETQATEAQKPAEDTKLAIIAKKEQAFRQQQLAFKAEREKAAAEMTAWEAEKSEFQKLKDREKRLLEDPYNVMLESGMTADQVAAKLLNQPNPIDQKVLLLEQEIKALKAASEQTSTKVDTAVQQQRDAAIKQIDANVKMMVDSNPEFETIKAKGKQDSVTKLIVETFDQDGRMMDEEEAAKEIEEYLLEEAMKDAQLNKVKARLGLDQEQKQAVTQKPQGAQTLSNRMVPSTKSLTWAERRARAIAVAEGKTPN